MFPVKEWHTKFSTSLYLQAVILKQLSSSATVHTIKYAQFMNSVILKHRNNISGSLLDSIPELRVYSNGNTVILKQFQQSKRQIRNWFMSNYPSHDSNRFQVNQSNIKHNLGVNDFIDEIIIVSYHQSKNIGIKKVNSVVCC